MNNNERFGDSHSHLVDAEVEIAKHKEGDEAGDEESGCVGVPEDIVIIEP